MKRLSYILLTAVMVFTLIGCGSDSGGGGGDAPSIPISTVDNSQPDISYFQGSSPKASSANVSSPNFSNAQSTVLGFGSFASIGQIYTPFFQQAQGNNASFNNGVWEWEYSYSYQGSSVSFRLTAEEISNGFNWDMYYTVNTTQGSFNDYNVISGFVNTDNTQGEWIFNSLSDGGGTEIPLIKSIWEVISNSERTIDINIYNDQGQVTDTIIYTENGDVHKMVISSAVVVYWDTDQQIGYYDPAQSPRVCWEGNATSSTDVDCSLVGLDS